MPGSLQAELASHWLPPLVLEYAARGAADGAMLFDYCTALREKLLVKNDRATMLSSIEARAPFLDRDLTALAFALPHGDKLHGLTTKWILKQAAKTLLPWSLVHRRKRGLSVPTATLINGALREDVDRAFDTANLSAHGLLDPLEMRRYLAEHRAGRANHARILWPAFVLQLWAGQWRPVMSGSYPAPTGKNAPPCAEEALLNPATY
ncbi:MAG: asn [Gammaproteobacteria bacterium]|nr:asn [Gammaproteobacteria bacterium]